MVCNCRGLVLIFLILLLYIFGGFFSPRDCNFLHFLTDISAPHRLALLQAPEVQFQNTVILKLHLLPAPSFFTLC